MKSIYFLFTLLYSFNFCNAQKFMQLKNGETIEFVNYKIKAREIKINLTQGKSIKLPVKDILGYYDTKIQEQYVFKYGEAYNVNEHPYFFDKLIVEGEVNIYERRHLVSGASSIRFGANGMVMPGTIGTSFTELYLEKKSDYLDLGATGKGKNARNERKATLRSFISDNTTLVKEIESQDFKCNDDDVIRIIKSYNLSKFNMFDKSNSNSSVFFYLKLNKVETDSFNLTINDSTAVKLNPKSMNPIQLSNTNFSKVCLNNYCEVMRGSPYYIKYIEIVVSENEVRFEKRISTDANRYVYNKSNF